MEYDRVSRKIIYISGTRADYGLMKATLKKIDNHPDLDIEVIVTGMHLMDEFGSTIEEIKKDNFPIHKVNSTFEKDNKESMSVFVGDFVKKLTKKIVDINPDFILLLGDRGEMLGGAIVGSYLSIPNVHLHGGEITSTVDEIARHAITKLSHIHLPANEKSAERIKKMGEDPKYVQVVGAPGIDSIKNKNFSSKNSIVDKYDIDTSKPLVLVVQHPVTMEVGQAKSQIRKTLEVIKDLEFQTILVYPNADAGGREMIKEIEEYEGLGFISTYKNIPRGEFIGLLNVGDVLIGNSSSGLIEAPSLNLPVVNIGTRQEGREKADNVVDVDYDKKDIKEAIEKCLFDEEFREKVKRVENPYGDGKAGDRITRILSNINIDEKLIQKSLKL